MGWSTLPLKGTIWNTRQWINEDKNYLKTSSSGVSYITQNPTCLSAYPEQALQELYYIFSST